jgi:LPXTG-site transpeptidase (sortase) family protein
MALRAIGRGFIGLGTLILLFLLYQLVGTNFVTGREQKALASEVKDQWATGVAEAPVIGNGMALIKIPKIGVDAVVVEGVEVEDLKKGPGHYPETALPGQLGNMVISGHRTTYGAPFYRLNELAKGDTITVVTREAIYTYTVTRTAIVRPTETQVLDNVEGPDGKPEATITLTTCHPRYSARQRLIVFGDLTFTSTNTGKVAA